MQKEYSCHIFKSIFLKIFLSFFCVVVYRIAMY
uniref:Uncharacterized protein n=1 Tax=Anguilla anguilla TaxID=7936 RepID=A0A0E9QKL5_ANGAN